MALTNIVPRVTTTHSSSLSGLGSPTNYGAASSVYDENLSTFYGCSYIGGEGGSNATIVSEHTWSTGIVISSIFFKAYCRNYSYGNYANRGADPLNSIIAYVKVNGSWTSVYNYTISNPGGDGAPNYETLKEETVTGSWSNCTGVKVYSTANSYAYEGANRSDCWAYIYEIKAFSQIYGDIGLVMKPGSTSYRIGCDALEASHKLRIRKGATTYGIPLVATTDANASGIRIYDGATVKALAKATT